MSNATVYERPDSPFIWAGFFCPKKLKHTYVKTPFRKDAPRAKFNALQWAAKKGMEGNSRKSLIAGEAWGAWVDAWLQDSFKSSPLTLARYGTAWKRWREFLVENKVLYPAAFTHAHILAFVKWREDPARSTRAVHRNTVLVEVKVMSGIMQEAVRRGFAQGNPALRPGVRSEPKRHYAMIQPDEDALIRELLLVEPKWMLECYQIAMKQGCRLMETSTPLDQVDLTRGTITFRAKRNKVFTTQLHPDLKPMMEAKIKAGEKRTVEIPDRASKAWWVFFKVKHRERLGHLCFHSTRVSVITKMCLANLPESKTMAYVGHASSSVHRIYQRLRAEDLSACTAVL